MNGGRCLAGLIDHVRGNRNRLHDLVRVLAHTQLLDEEDPVERGAQEPLNVHAAGRLGAASGRWPYADRSDRFAPDGFTSLDKALRRLDDGVRPHHNGARKAWTRRSAARTGRALRLLPATR